MLQCSHSCANLARYGPHLPNVHKGNHPLCGYLVTRESTAWPRIRRQQDLPDVPTLPVAVFLAEAVNCHRCPLAGQTEQPRHIWLLSRLLNRPRVQSSLFGLPKLPCLPREVHFQSSLSVRRHPSTPPRNLAISRIFYPATTPSRVAAPGLQRSCRPRTAR